jgi:hypothetical protein
MPFANDARRLARRLQMLRHPLLHGGAVNDDERAFSPGS